MSSGSVMGRCRITVPAAEKMTTRMINTTPVLMELRVCQVLRTAERSDGAITFLFLACCQCTFPANRGNSCISLFGKGLWEAQPFCLELRMSHNTHEERRVVAISPS